MRKILFRGKRKNSGEWVYGNLICSKNYAIESQEFPLEKPIVVIPDTIGQYTGIKDIKGIRIFEGDLLSIPNSNKQGLPAKVVYSDVDARFEIQRIGFNPIPLDGENGRYEIVGNIYD